MQEEVCLIVMRVFEELLARESGQGIIDGTASTCPYKCFQPFEVPPSRPLLRSCSVAAAQAAMRHGVW